MPPLIEARRRRAVRAMLSALAGGGVTAAGIGGVLSGSAQGAGTPTSSEGATTPATVPSSSPPAPEGPTGPPSTTTSTPTTTAPPAGAGEPQTSPAPPGAPEAPTVVLQRKQKASRAGPPNPALTTTKAKKPGKSSKPATKTASGPNNVAPSPQSVAQAGALAAMLASSNASAQALAFYRIPLFLLPIYKAAAVQYGVPWQILAAINEIETNYGTDLSVSSAGAVGWMQFMPATWLQYGVDALNAGYADPYNPVDAIFAAARYLRAAGAANDLRAAILAYNHSQEYVNSVLLRAKLISTYPKPVIATLTGLIDGRLPVTGTQLAWTPSPSASPPASSATANATAVPSQPAGASNGASGPSNGAGQAGASTPGASTPGSSPAPPPTAAAAGAQGPQLVDVTSAPTALVVAVQDGRVVQIGHSRQLGKFVILRDVYGDVFTYAGLGSIASSYSPAKSPRPSVGSPVVEAASTRAPAPSQPASAGTQSPLTLRVKTPLQGSAAPTGQYQASAAAGTSEATPAGMGKIRLYAHPGNPDALAAAALSAAQKAHVASAAQRLALRVGSVVATGTVLGRVSVTPGAQYGHLRFAIRPAGDPATIDPRPILANWAQLQRALHQQGATATDALLGATASDVFLLSQAQLERAVLSDPGITMSACGRHDVVSGAVDRRVLAVLAFLSRSGLKPTVSALPCGRAPSSASGALSAQSAGDAVDISAINGIPIAGHQGAGTITDLTIRTLLTLPGEFVPQEILSLMRYPGSPNTHALPTYGQEIRLLFSPAPAAVVLGRAATGTAAQSARSGASAPLPALSTSALSAAQWNQLITRVAALPSVTVATKPSSSAIPDPKRP